MSNEKNRVLGDLDRWKATEKRFSELFGPSIIQSRAFQKEKLQNLKDRDERIASRLVRQERKQLEGELYPGGLKRNLLRFYRAVKRFVKSTLRFGQKMLVLPTAVVDQQRLIEKTRKNGFKLSPKELQGKMAQGKDFSINIPGKGQAGEAINYSLDFKMDQSGRFQYPGYRISTIRDGQQVSMRISKDIGLTPVQALGLLSGRPVLKDSKWLAMDRSDKDSDGNFRLKSVPLTSKNDPARLLTKLPIKENNMQTTRGQLLERIKNGERVNVTAIEGKKFFGRAIEMSLSRGLEIFDQKGKKLLNKKPGHASSNKNNKSHRISPSQTNGLKVK